jgi:hypothetical protein
MRRLKSNAESIFLFIDSITGKCIFGNKRDNLGGKGGGNFCYLRIINFKSNEKG